MVRAEPIRRIRNARRADKAERDTLLSHMVTIAAKAQRLCAPIQINTRVLHFHPAFPSREG